VKLIRYTFKRLNKHDYQHLSGASQYYFTEGYSEAEMVVRINGRDLYAKSLDYEVPEKYIRRKLEDQIMYEIRRELFGNV